MASTVIFRAPNDDNGYVDDSRVFTVATGRIVAVCESGDSGCQVHCDGGHVLPIAAEDVSRVKAAIGTNSVPVTVGLPFGDVPSVPLPC